MRAAHLGACAVALALAAPAHADEGPRYGLETLAVDATGFSLGGVGARLDSKLLVASGVVLYLVGAPAIHLAHDREGAALGSIGLRLALPAAGSLVGAGLGRLVMPRGEFGFVTIVAGGALGMIAGAAGACVVDAIWLAREDPAATPVMFQLGGQF